MLIQIKKKILYIVHYCKKYLTIWPLTRIIPPQAAFRDFCIKHGKLLFFLGV